MTAFISMQPGWFGAEMRKFVFGKFGVHGDSNIFMKATA